mmetsp:Transcript_26276/g.37659  ORF Transcript_26276/g.37659 Transcript_26276/m.37659 type:complete len:330 (-) Transcript_26276:201-1190(-)
MFSLATGLYQFYFTPSSISLLIIGCDGVGKTALLERCKITKFSQRRFAPSSVAANCRSGRVGRSRPSINSKESSKQEQTRPKQPLQQRRQYDLPEAFNMDKIRPTVGQNIAKIDLFGAKAVLWDLGGQVQMRPLWERYYNDCDGLVFVVEASMFYKNGEIEEVSTGDSSSKFVTTKSRLHETKDELNKILQDEGLRDVPILIFVNKLDQVLSQHQQYQGHEEEDLNEFWADELCECVMQRLGLYTTVSNADCSSSKANGEEMAVVNGDRNSLEQLEEGSLNVLARLAHPGGIEVYVGSAKTGQGVRVAMEWLVQTARATPTSFQKRLTS